MIGLLREGTGDLSRLLVLKELGDYYNLLASPPVQIPPPPHPHPQSMVWYQSAHFLLEPETNA